MSPISILHRIGHLWQVAGLLAGLGIAAFFGGCVPTSETQIVIPVETADLPGQLSIVSVSEKGIEVRLRGTQGDLAAYSAGGPKYMLDLSGVQPGIQSIPINSERIPLTEGVELIGFQPSFITLSVEKEMKKRVPVSVVVDGNPGAGYRLGPISAHPESVVLIGPETAVIPVEKVDTKPIDVSGRAESFKKEVALDLPENVTRTPAEEMIVGTVAIEETIVVKTFENVPVEGRGAGGDVDIRPPELTLSVRGPQSVLSGLCANGDLEVWVDLKGLQPGVYVRRATITLPVSTSLMDVKPELFTVTIGEKPPLSASGRKADRKPTP